MGRIVHCKPGQRAVCGVGLQRGIERWCSLVAHIAHAPVAALRGGMHGIEHGAHLVHLLRQQHLARRAKSTTQARGCSVERLGEVDAGRLGRRCENTRHGKCHLGWGIKPEAVRERIPIL